MTELQRSVREKLLPVVIFDVYKDIVVAIAIVCYFFLGRQSFGFWYSGRLASMPSKPKKLPRNLSLQDHVALLGDDQLDPGHQRKKLRMELLKPLSIERECGALLRSMTVTLGDKSYEWHYLHPCALLIELCNCGQNSVTVCGQ